MKKVVSFSGGRTSAYLCHLMIEKFGRDNVDFIYMDTGAEHKLTYKFIRECNDHFNLGLVCLRGDFSLPMGNGVGYNVVDINDIGQDLKPYKEMMAKYGVPYIGGMFCTDRMKLKPYKKYCDNKYGKGKYETWIGIRFDEHKRLVGDNPKYPLKSAYKQLVIDGLSDDEISLLYVKSRKNINEINQWEISSLSKELLVKRISELDKENLHYLAEISQFEKKDIISYWSKMPFDLLIDEWSGNCEFCPKKSNLKLAASRTDSPSAYVKFLDALYDDSVRADDKTGHWSKMYRGSQSLEQLIATFDGSTGSEIKDRIRGTKSTDSGSCSESCEVFNCQLDWVNETKNT